MVNSMEIIFSNDDNEYNIEFKDNLVIFGGNGSGKTKILTLLFESIKKGKAIINSLKFKKDDFNVLFFSEESDFSDEFSFTKSNIFRATIYNSIMDSLNKEKLLKEVNSTFDKIDNKVNEYLNENVNLFFNNSIKFDINIDDLDNIINKFTTVYINDLNDDKKVPKSFKRMLIYQLSLLNFKDDKEKFILIDDFDLYMDSNNIIQILNFISKYSSDKCHFILSTSNPLVYNYLNSSFDIYRVKNEKLYKFSHISYFIEKAILRNEYEKTRELISFDEFYNNNISLVNDEDVNDFYNKYFNYLKTDIGIILTSEFIYFNNIKYNGPYILTRNEIELFFLKFICDELLTEYKIIDIL